jgi:uncharacterized protein (TIGR02466 family)
MKLFPTEIKYHKNFINIENINNIINYSKKYNLEKHGSLIGDAVSNHYLNKNILEEDIKNKLNKVIIEYSNILGIKEQTLNHSWSNFQRKNSRLEKHSHGISPISGVLYLKTDEDSSKIYFYNPNPYIYIMDIKNFNENNCGYISFKPEIGDLILFPGWLMHGSNNDINLSEERIALSFNTKDI